MIAEEEIDMPLYSTWYDDRAGESVISIEDCAKLMVQFAKYHVKKALDEACKNVPDCEERHTINPYEVEENILKCYPLQNIK
jgi:hypothetical protein